MTLSLMSSTGLIALAAAASVATGSLWSQRDQGAIDAQSAEKYVLGSACMPGNANAEAGADTAPSTAYAGCQGYFQSYPPYASVDAIFRSAGR